MPVRFTILFVIIAGFAAAVASQRMLRDDSGPRWFPAQDYSPDSPAYPLDRMGEKIDLLFASRGEERLELCLLFADEKFEEALDMVRANEAGHAWIAVGLYKDYLERGARELGSNTEAVDPVLRSRFVEAIVGLLRRLATQYAELPDQIRAFSLIPLISATLDHFDQQFEMLPVEEKQRWLIVRQELKTRIASMRTVDR